jgi:hypothetical protein
MEKQDAECVELMELASSLVDFIPIYVGRE